MAVLGGHDLGLSLSQTVPVERVFDLPQEDGFPPKNDLSLLRLAVPARLGGPAVLASVVARRPTAALTRPSHPQAPA